MTKDKISAPIPIKPSIDPLERCSSLYEGAAMDHDGDQNGGGTANAAATASTSASNNNAPYNIKSSSEFSKQFKSFTPNASKQRNRSFHFPRRPSYCTLESARESFYNLDYPADTNQLAREQLDPKSRFYSRRRERTLNLPLMLPYQIESPTDQAKFLSHIVSHLYIAIKTLDLQGALSVTAKDLASVKANLSDVDVALETNLFEIGDSGPQQHFDDETSAYFSVDELHEYAYDDVEDDDDDDEDDDDEEDDEEVDDDDDEASKHELVVQHKRSPKSAAIVGVRIWTQELLVWLKMKYDMPIKLRVLLARVYYAICLSRGQHINMKTYVRTFEILTKDNYFMRQQGLKLPWEPLCKELMSHFPGNRTRFSQWQETKDQKQLLKLAEKASFFIDKSALPIIYSKIGSQFDIQHSSQILLAFSILPMSFTAQGRDNPEDIRHYVSSFFYIWQKISKKSGIDVHLTSRLGTVAMSSLLERANSEQKDLIVLDKFGVFTADQISFIFNSLMNSLSIMKSKYSSMKTTFFHGYSSAIIFSIIGENALVPEVGILDKILMLTNAIELYIYPSNSGEWSRPISKLLVSLIYQFHKRYNMETQPYGLLNSLPNSIKLSSNPSLVDKFVMTVLPTVKIGLQAKIPGVSNDFLRAMNMLAYIRPEMVLESMLLDIYESLEGVNSTHRLTVALRTLDELSRYFAATPVYRVHVARILLLVLPGVDSNDLEKSYMTLNVFASMASFIPFSDLSNGEGDSTLAIQFTLGHLEYLQSKLVATADNDTDMATFIVDPDLELSALKSSTSAFKLLFQRLLARIFTFLENLPDPTKSGMEKYVANFLPSFIYVILESVSDDIYHMIAEEMFKFVNENTYHTIADVVAEICGGIVKRDPKLYFKKFAIHLMDKVREDIEENGAGASRTGVDIISRDQPLWWNLVILNECIGNANSHVLELQEELKEFSFFLMDHVKGPGVFASTYMLNLMLQATTKIRLNENRLISPLYEKEQGISEKCWGGFQFSEERFKKENLDFSWYIPSTADIKFAVDTLNEHVAKCLVNILSIMKKFSDPNHAPIDLQKLVHFSDEIRMNLLYLGYGIGGISFLFDPSFDEDIPKLSQHQNQTIQQRFQLLNQIRRLKGEKSQGKDELRIENIHLNLQHIVDDLRNDEFEYDQEKDNDETRNDKRSGERGDDDDGDRKRQNGEDVDMEALNGTKENVAAALAAHFNIGDHLSLVASSDSISSMVDASARQSPGIDGVEISTMNPGITFRDHKLYTSNYLFGDDIESRRSNELYIKVHKIRHLVGKSLHVICKFLLTHFHDNTQLFLNFLYVLGVWFSDVGRERVFDSSHAKVSFSYLNALQQVNRVRKPFTRGAIASRVEAYHQFRVVLHATSRTQTDLDKLLLEDIVKLSFSTYSNVSNAAQTALSETMKRLNGSYNVLIRSSLKYLSKAIEDKDLLKIESGLHTFNLKRIKNKIQNDFFNIQKYVELLQKCLVIDENQVNELAQELIEGVYTSLTPPSSVCIIHDMEEINCIRPPDEFIDLEINVVKLAKESKRKIYLEKLKKYERMILNNEKQNTHWKSTSLNLLLLNLLQEELEISINTDYLLLLANEASNDHPTISRVAIRGVNELSDKIQFLKSIDFDLKNAYDLNYLPRNIISIDTRPSKEGASFYERWREELQNTENPNYFLDDKYACNGWIFWGETTKFIRADVDWNDEQADPVVAEALQAFASWISKDWFLNIAKTWITENEASNTFQGSNAAFSSTISTIIAGGFAKNMTYSDLLSVIEEVYDPDEKSSHFVVCEIVCGLLISTPKIFMNKKVLKERDDFLTRFMGKIFEKDLNPDISGVWSVFSWLVPGSIDIRRIPQLVSRMYTSFQIDQNSDSAFYIASRIGYLKDFISSVTWMYTKADATALMCVNNIDNRYQAIRDKVGALLATLTFAFYKESLASSETFLEECNSEGSSKLLKMTKFNKLQELIPTIFERIETSRLEVVHLSPQEILQSSYIYSVSTVLTWLREGLGSRGAIVYQDYVVDYFMPFLIKISNMKDVCQLGDLDPVTVFKRISQIPFTIEKLDSIIAMIENYSTSDTLNVVQSFIMGEFTETFYFKNLYLFTSTQRKRIIALTNNLIYHKNVEVRESASSTLSGLIHISPPNEVGDIVKSLVSKYSKDLDKTRRKYRKKGFKELTNDDSIVLHAATLGLGALIHAFPFQSPPPAWVPELLTILASKSSGISGIIGKTAKEILGQFKKDRQDTWHIDNKVFNEDQLQDLEGVLWKSYFI